MNYSKAISFIALLSTSNAWAATSSYYEYEILSPDTTGSNYGPFPSAITEAGDTVGVYALKADLDQNIDIGLPFTFNQECFYDDEVCELIYYGSEDSTDASYDNGYQAWRTTSAEIDNNETDATSYFLAATNNVKIEGFGDDTDVKITDVVDSDEGSFAVGYGSGPYTDGERDYVRRAFVVDPSTSYATISLIPTAFDDDEGGFSSAYRMRDVTYNNGETKTLIVGNASKSLAGGDSDYFDLCYNEGDEDDLDDLNYLVNCPGFDTQAWAWEYDSSATEIEGFALATEWLDDNTTRDGSDATYSAAAFDINSSGVAVGVSTYELSDSDEGGRQRAIIMTPDDDGAYDTPTVIVDATDESDSTGDYDKNDDTTYYNSWAESITDENVVMGNRQYGSTKNVNYPIEMFIYDIDNDSISIPLEDTKVLSTKQRLAGDSASYRGANSYGYDMNENGLIVGSADAYDQTDPVVGGSPRTQSAFLYDNTSGDSWFIDDLLCTEDDDGVVTHPLIRLESATAINDDGVVLAEGFQYDSDSDYNSSINATAIMVKLTPSTTMDPDDSPNCWDSETLADSDSDSSRSGAATLWLWLLILPLAFARRLNKNKV
ncbi:DUF3466 family protein [Psychromonas sp. 14N.309.X.WAT.B.A12]|uniref:DUF3466 family protein n=1 Tax=Psychromonas sp. 14N.309.X.WAT.B.A12 TaxID=2998322 RepID=UPI0025B0228F|nr:DUF3466 family protein [Psychromonas sp. 14N.309.X.WAT.B.A12]MDN2661797.1 DUF3466 family protein [Psychromonas sp. 14N.309.X.WAT.B.A12]